MPLQSGVSRGDVPRDESGDRHEPIFRDDEDRRGFLSTLGEVCGKTGWRVHVLCLMPRQFHLVSEAPTANMMAGMRWLLGNYTLWLPHRRKLRGHVFSGPAFCLC